MALTKLFSLNGQYSTEKRLTMSSPDLLNVAKSKMAECLEQNRPKQTGLICWVIKPDGPIPYFKDEQDQRAFQSPSFRRVTL